MSLGHTSGLVGGDGRMLGAAAAAASRPMFTLHACRHLSSRLFTSKGDFNPLFSFLATLKHNGQSLMLNERIADTDAMIAALEAAEHLLSGRDDEVCSFGQVQIIVIVHWLVDNGRQGMWVGKEHTCYHALVGLCDKGREPSAQGLCGRVAWQDGVLPHTAVLA